MTLYNREWLNRVHQTKEMIPKVRALIEQTPVHHRRVMMQAFRVATACFDSALHDGRYPHAYSNDITALGALALEVIKESERADLPADS